MIKELATILQSNFFVGFIVLLVVIPLYLKLGILDKLWGKNGKIGIEKQLENLGSNHLHTINETLQRIEKILGEVLENTIIIKTKQNGK